jgi:tetratricopeptide (TPR) repeat protein
VTGQPGPGRELAVLLSIAARIEPELMRAVRLRAAPGLDVAAEVDFWFGGLVAHRGYGHVVLNPQLLGELRAELSAKLRRAAGGDPVHRLWPTFVELREGESPALIAQETANWRAVSGDPDADWQIDEALRPALRALVEEERDGIALWFTEAWETFPERVQRSATAWQLLTLSAARLDQDLPAGPRPQRLALGDAAVIAEGLPKAPLHLAWEGPRLRLSDVPFGPDEFAVMVPDTDPRIVELVTANSVRTILVGRDASVEEWVGPEGGRLHTADGSTYALPSPILTQPDSPLPDDPWGGGPTSEGDEPAGNRATGHISICFAGESRPWAKWAAHLIEAAGQTTTLLHWDTASRTPTESLGSLLAAPGQVLLLINDRALRPDLHDEAAWAEAFRLVVAPNRDRFAAITLSETLPGATALLRPVDLAGLDESQARRRVLETLGVDPGEDPPHPDGPRFPNDQLQARETPRRNTQFTGRKDDLEELSELLADPGPTGARVVLHGISGVGKTQLATEYAHRYGDGYDIVWWVTSGPTAREEFAALAAHLHIAVGRDVGERVRAVQSTLRGAGSEPRRRWLLIFDGADTVGEIRDLLPDGHGDVLVTSLSRDWAGMLGFQEFTVRPFTRTESTAFIRRRVPHSTGPQADRLAEAAEDLPLVLAQTTGWLSSNPDEPVDDYLDALERQSPEELAVRTEPDYTDGFVRAWGLLLSTLRERNPESAELIELMVMFSPDAIPLRLIAAAPPGVFQPGGLASTVSDSTRWENALAGLADLAAIHLNFSQDPSREWGVETARMHGLYHRFVRGNLSGPRRTALTAVACGVLAAANPGRPRDQREWPVYTRLIPHLDYAGALDRDEPEVRKLVLDCVDTLVLRGEYDTGLRLCQQAVTRWGPRHPDTHPDMLIMRHQHANILRRVGRYRDAEAVGRAVVDGLAGSAESDDPNLLRAKDGLGGTLMALGQFERSRALFEEVWRGYANRSGPQDPYVVSARGNMALTLGLLGRYAESLQIHLELFELRGGSLGADHFRTLYSGLCLAWMTRLLGRYREALAVQEPNARLHSRVLGPHHPQTLRAEHNLAQCLRRDGQLDEATSLFTSVVDRSRQAQGEVHPETLMMASDQAALLRSTSPRQAHELARTVYERYLRLLGPDHPYTAGSLGNLALAQWSDGDERGEADAAAHTSWRQMVRAVGDDHPWTLGCRLNLAAGLALSGQAQQALAHDTDLIEPTARQLGAGHPLSLAAATARACDLRTLDRTEEAEELRLDVVARLRDSLGPQHPHTRSAEALKRPHWDFEPQPI